MVLARVSMAKELKFNLIGEVGYSSNVYRVHGDAVSDLTYRFNPRMRLEDKSPPLSYEVEYSPRFVGYLENVNIDVWDQYGRLAVERAFGEQTRLSATNRFSRYSSRLFEDLEDAEATEPDLGLTRNIRNDAKISLFHTLTRRAQVSAVFGHEFARFEQDIYADWEYLSASLMFFRSMSSRDTVGLGGVFGYRSFDDFVPSDAWLLLLNEYLIEYTGDPLKNASLSRSYHAFVYAKHTFNDDFEILLRAGPTWLQVSQWAPSLVQYRVSASRFTWFGLVEIKKRWREALVSASYNRDETAMSGSNQSAVADSITARASWKPNADWWLELRSSWSRQQSEYSAGDSQTSEVWNHAVRIRRRLTRRVSLLLRVGYHRQQFTGDSAYSGVDSYEDYSGQLGFDYAFSAIRF
jgi:hypothetical protein